MPAILTLDNGPMSGSRQLPETVEVLLEVVNPPPPTGVVSAASTSLNVVLVLIELRVPVVVVIVEEEAVIPEVTAKIVKTIATIFRRMMNMHNVM